MMSEMLATRDGIHEALDRAETIGEVKTLGDKLAALEIYARRQGATQIQINQLAEGKLMAERRAGELLGQMEKAPAGRPPENRFHDETDSLPTLAELGIGKTQSHRWQTEAALPEDRFADFVAEIVNKNAELTSHALYEEARKFLGKVHVSQNSGQNEWYTPPQYIEAARAVLGTINLDPASSDIANKIVQAERYYTAEDDGLSAPWDGRVWMNPPYSSDLIGKFSDKLAQHFVEGNITEAIVLVNNATETAWFQGMLIHAAAVCFISRRVRFIDMNGEPSGAPLQGQAVLYLGHNEALFAEIFSQFGKVLYG